MKVNQEVFGFDGLPGKLEMKGLIALAQDRTGEEKEENAIEEFRQSDQLKVMITDVRRFLSGVTVLDVIFPPASHVRRTRSPIL